jgi:exopolysaccharide biosynthesis protein
VNASYFLPFAGGSPGGDDYYPKIGDPVNVSGAEMSAGETQSPVETDLDIRVNAIVCFSGLRVDIADGQVCPQGHTDGVAAGPRLLAAGQRRSFRTFDNNYAVMRHPRSAMGVTADRRRAWIVVVDGRQKGYSDGATLDELTDIFVSLGAAEALNLDGGGSSTLVVEDEAGAAVILNRPIHTGVPGRERPVANQILLVAAGD